MSFYNFDDGWDEIGANQTSYAQPAAQPQPVQPKPTQKQQPQPVGTPAQTYTEPAPQQTFNKEISQPQQPVQKQAPPQAYGFEDDWNDSFYTSTYQPNQNLQPEQTFESKETFVPEYTEPKPTPQEPTYVEEKFVEEPVQEKKIEPEITRQPVSVKQTAKPQGNSWSKPKNWNNKQRKPPMKNKNNNKKKTGMEKPAAQKAVAKKVIKPQVMQEPVQPATPLSTEEIVAQLQERVQELELKVDELEMQSRCVCNITSNGDLDNNSGKTLVCWNDHIIPPESDCFLLEDNKTGLTVLQGGVYEIKSSVRGIEMKLLINGQPYAIGYSNQDKCPYISTVIILDNNPKISVQVERQDYKDKGDAVNNFLCVRKVGN